MASRKSSTSTSSDYTSDEEPLPCTAVNRPVSTTGPSKKPENVSANQKQELYSAQKRLQCLTKMKFEMEIEIEALNGLHQINSNLESKVKELENNLSVVRTQSVAFENQLLEERNNNEILTRELKSQITDLQMKLDFKGESISEEAVNELQTNCCTLQDENKSLAEMNNKLNTNNEELTRKVSMFESILEDKVHEFEEMEELMNIKSNDLKSTLILVKELQDEKAMLSTEIMTLKNTANKPNVRGNSIFAEVEDKRISVTSKLTVLQNKYKELKSSFMKKNAEVKKLECENNELRKKWKEDNDAPYEALASVVENYKTRVSELSHMVAELEKRPESPQIISVSNLNDVQINCIKGMIEYERNLNRELKTEMEQRSIRELMQGEELFRVKQNLRTLKTQSMIDASTINDLRLELDTYKDNVSGYQSIITERYNSPNKNALKEIKNGQSCYFETKNYSVPGDKTVRFDESIMESSCVTNVKLEDSRVIFKKPSIYDKARTVNSIKVDKENVL